MQIKEQREKLRIGWTKRGREKRGEEFRSGRRGEAEQGRMK